MWVAAERSLVEEFPAVECVVAADASCFEKGAAVPFDSLLVLDEGVTGRSTGEDAAEEVAEVEAEDG